MVMWLSWPVSQVIRYRRYSTAVERQQTKWVVYAAGDGGDRPRRRSTVIGTAIDPNLPELYDDLGQVRATAQSVAVYLGWQTAMRILFLLVPVAFAIFDPALRTVRHRSW